MIDLKNLSTQELLQLQKDVDDAVIKIQPQEPDYYIRPYVRMETKEHVNNEIVPVFEFTISISKEVLHTYRILWKKFYEEEDELNLYKYHLSPDDRITFDIRKDLEYAFSDLMDKNFRIQQ